MKFEVVVIVLLALVAGYFIARFYDKRKQDIIKLLIKRDMLPEPGEGTRWIPNEVCYMSNGECGVVKGNYCEQISVL